VSQYSRWPQGAFATKVVGAVAGDLAGLNALGNLTDSGLSITQVSGYNLRLNALENSYVRSSRFASVSTVSGAVTLPPGAIVVLDDFGGTVDAVVSALEGGRPTYAPVYDTAGAAVSTSFDASGNYVLSGTPAATPVGIVYRVRQKQSDFDSTASNILGAPQVELLGWPIFQTDPVSPALGQQWILDVPGIPMTGLYGSGMVGSPGGVGDIVFAIHSTDLVANQMFGGDGTYGFITFQNGYPPGTFNIFPGNPSTPMVIQLDQLHTYDDVVNGLNAWAATNMPVGTGNIVSLSVPADGSILVTSQLGIGVSTDGVDEQMWVKIKSPSSGVLYGGTLGPI
jgi:hypothetical protein